MCHKILISLLLSVFPVSSFASAQKSGEAEKHADLYDKDGHTVFSKLATESVRYYYGYCKVQEEKMQVLMNRSESFALRVLTGKWKGYNAPQIIKRRRKCLWNEIRECGGGDHDCIPNGHASIWRPSCLSSRNVLS